MKRVRPQHQTMARSTGVVLYKRQRLSGPQQAAVTREVKKELNKRTDWKYADTIVGTTAISFSGSIGSLYTNLVRGDVATNNFDGSKVTPKYVQIKYQLVSSVLTANDYSTMRIIIGQSLIPGTPLVTDILANIGAQTAPLSLRRYQQQKNHKILHDNLVSLNTNDNPSATFSVFIKGNRLIPTEFTTSGTLSITKGDIWALAISDDGVTTYPSFSYQSRVMFSD